MSIAGFESDLRNELLRLDHVLEIKIKQRSPISLYCTISLEKSYTLIIFYNHQYTILSFSLIYANKRIWGLDKDNRIGWHIHPLNNPESHEKIEEIKISEIISFINLIIKQLVVKE